MQRGMFNLGLYLQEFRLLKVVELPTRVVIPVGVWCQGPAQVEFVLSLHG